MENNDSPIVDYASNTKKKFRRFLILAFIIFLIGGSVFGYIERRKESENKRLAEQKAIMQITRENSKVSLRTKFDRYFLTREEFEFNYAVIPTASTIVPDKYVLSYEDVVETNKITYNSRAIKIKYASEAALTLDIFRDRLEKYHGYERFIYVFEDEAKVYVRDEEDGYFSYIIFEDLVVTYGVGYGEPAVTK